MRRYERKALPSVFIPSLFFLYIYIHKTRSQSRPERHSASVGLAVRTRRPPSLSPKHSRGAILRVVSRVPLLCSNLLCYPRVCCGFSRLWCESRKLFNDFESIFINKKQNVFKEIEERSSSRLGIIMFFFCFLFQIKFYFVAHRGGFGRCHVRQDDSSPTRGAQIIGTVDEIHPKGDSAHLPRLQTGSLHNSSIFVT